MIMTAITKAFLVPTVLWLAQPTAPIDISPVVPLQPSLEICRFALAQVAQPSGIEPKQVIENYINRGHLTVKDASTQRSLCAVYFLGISDFIGLQSPKT